ncbi:unnamed protein product [Prunus armeniaca]
MDTVGILVCYNGSWVKKDNIESYEGGEAKGIIVSQNVTFSDLVQRIYKIMDADPTKYIVTLKYSVPVSSSVCKHIRVEDNDDVKYFVKYNTDVMASKVTPLVASLKNIEGHGIEGCNGIVSVESSNAPTDFVVEQRNVEPQSAPILHPHEDSNVEPSTVQCRHVQSEPPRQSSSTEMHTSRGDLKHGQSLEYIQYGGGVSCINWEANLKVGRVYPNKIALLKTISLAAIIGHFRLRTVQSGKRRLCVRCWQLPCPWKVRAYKVGLHEFKDSRNIYTAANIKKDVKQNFGVSISYSTAWRSRELAFKRIRGSAEESYSLLPSYCYELERTNPGTLTYIETDAADHFLYFFMAIGACIRGFKWSMRPVIVVDATHLKCKYRGVLFVATAFDGNRNIYPVAFGIGDLETDAAWEWFLRKLHCAIGDCSNLVIISDRKVSIQNGLRRVFPGASHGICFYHLKGNIKASFKLKQQDPILGYLCVQKWSRAHCDGRRYNVMTTNIVESINSVLRFARMLPVLHLIDEITNLLVCWFRQRRELAMKSHSTLCPDLGEIKLRKRLDAASRMNVVKINEVEYNVLDGDLNGLVHLQNRSCTCRKFDLEQLPCKPAIAKVKILPPLCKVMPGRRKTQRIASKGEESRQKKCSRCGVKGHYRSTCKQSVPLTNKQHVA